MAALVAIACPEILDLEAFLHERLSTDRVNVVESHVEECTLCQEMLEGLVDAGSLESLLRRRAGGLFDSERVESASSCSVDPAMEATNLVDASDTAPLSIGGYRILAELGRGAFAVVYHARDHDLERDVAIKVPRPELLTAVGIETYLKEARTLALLDHPAIVRVHEARADGRGSCYVVSQFVDGRNLSDRIDEGPIAHREAARLVSTIARALQHAHERGIYHRDVKPANILLDRVGEAFLADFGLALNETEIGLGPRQLGTPAYTSPEQARGEGHHVDGRTDVFSLGVVFYKMLTGRRPFMARRIRELLDLIVNVDPPSARQRNLRVPVELDRICSRALARNPADRYPAAGDLADDLDAWLGSYSPSSDRAFDPLSLPTSGVDSSTGTTCVPDIERRAGIRRQLSRRSVVAGLFLAAALIGFALCWKPDQPAEELGRPPERLAPRSLRVGIKAWVGYAPLVVAKELGLCEGVDIEFVDVTSTSDVGRRFLAGEIDCAGYLVDSHALARAERIPTRAILLVDRSLTADAIVACQGIESFAALRGKSIAYVHHEAPHFLLLSLCEEHGLGLDAFRHIKTESLPEAIEFFAKGHVDAVVGYDPFLEQCLRRVPGAKRVASAADVPGSIIDLLVAHEEIFRTRPHQVRALIAGVMDGLSLLEHRDPRALEIACRFLGTPVRPITVEEYDDMVRGMQYSGVAENLDFFTPDDRGHSEFRTRVDAAQDRWARHHQLARRTDPEDGDGSSLLLQMYDPEGQAGSALAAFGSD